MLAPLHGLPQRPQISPPRRGFLGFLGAPIGPNTAVMQADGNFVVYDSQNVPLWNSQTQNNPGAFLVMQGDGNLVLYSADHRPLWDIHQGGRTPTAIVGSIGGFNPRGSTLGPGQSLNEGDGLISDNGAFVCILQWDGNLVVYDLSQNPPGVLWSPYTSDQQTSPATPQPSTVAAGPGGTSVSAAPPADPNEAIIQQVLAPFHSYNTCCGPGSYWHDFVLGCLNSGILDPGGDYAQHAGICAGTAPDQSMQIAAQALGVGGAAAGAGLSVAASSGAIAASTAGLAVPIIGAGIAVASLFMWLFNRPTYGDKEGKILCASVPTVNQVLQQIDAELRAGYIDAPKAISSLDQLRAAFNNVLQPILYNLDGNRKQTGNTSQLLLASLDALIIQRNQIYPGIAQQVQDQISAQKAAAAAAQQAQINQAVQAAVAAALPAQPGAPNVSTPTPTSVVPNASAVPQAPAPVSTVPAAAVSPTPVTPVSNTPAPGTVQAQVSSSWFDGSTQFGSLQIPNWLLLAIGGVVALEAI